MPSFENPLDMVCAVFQHAHKTGHRFGVFPRPRWVGVCCEFCLEDIAESHNSTYLAPASGMIYVPDTHFLHPYLATSAGLITLCDRLNEGSKGTSVQGLSKESFAYAVMQMLLNRVGSEALPNLDIHQFVPTRFEREDVI
jgi:hypothetical protein